MLMHKDTKGKRKGNVIWLIPELCYLTGTTRKMKDNRNFCRRFAELTSSTPRDRLQTSQRIVRLICDEINRVNSQKKGRKPSGIIELGDIDLQNIDSMPIDIESSEIEMTGRTLPQVSVKLKMVDRGGRGSNRQSNAGSVATLPVTQLQRSWTEARFLNKPSKDRKISKWVIIFEGSDEQIRASRILYETMKSLGTTMSIWGEELSGNPRLCKIQIERSQSAISQWETQCSEYIKRNSDIEFAVVVIPDRERHGQIVYGSVKSLFYVQFGIKCQCVKGSNCLGNRMNQVTKGVLKQMMAKANNELWRVNFTDLSQKMQNMLKNDPTIVIGIDVNHDWKADVSTVGIAVSNNFHFNHYWCYVGFQNRRIEIVECIVDVIYKAIKSFYKKFFKFEKNRLIKNIIIYRDGVSDSQLKTILNQEISSVEKAIQLFKSKLGDKEKALFDPKIQVIVVQKNVSIRFVSKRFESIPPGTIVDTKVGSARYWDFYLTAHEPPRPIGRDAPKKTATPTRYIVLRDDLMLSNDDIQIFTNYLCSLYFNWPGPIRVPAAVKYADRLAYLFGSIMTENEQPHDNIHGSLYML